MPAPSASFEHRQDIGHPEVGLGLGWDPALVELVQQPRASKPGTDNGTFVLGREPVIKSAHAPCDFPGIGVEAGIGEPSCIRRSISGGVSVIWRLRSRGFLLMPGLVRLVEANGPDIVRNGLALSGTAHWIFDRGLICRE